MADSPPDSFVITDSSSTWSISATSVWSAIFADTTLGLQPNPPPSGASSTISISSSYFWGLSFSNSSNAGMFNGDSSPVVPVSHYTPPVQGGVLGMVKPATGLLASSISFNDVATKFGISSTNSPALLTSFMTAVDSASLALSLDTTSTTRNAFWAVPGGFYQIVVSLTFDITTTGSLNQLQTFINKQFGLNLALTTINPQVIFTSYTSYTQDPTNPSSVTASTTPNYSLSVQFSISEFNISAVFTPTDLKLMFSDLGTSPAGSSVFQQLQSAGLTSSSASGSPTSLSATALPDNSKTGSTFDSFFQSIKLWNLTIGFDSATSGSSGGNGDVYWAVGLLGRHFHVGSSLQDLLVAITYDSRTTTFEGELVTSLNIPSPRQYDYQSWKDIDSSLVSPGSSVDFSSTFGGNKPPQQIPTSLPEAVIIYQKSQGRAGYHFLVSLSIGDNSLNTPPGSKPAPNGFDWGSIQINLLLQNDGINSSTNIQVLSHFALPLPSGSPAIAPPSIDLDLQYDSTRNYWLLEAEANNIQIASLGSYFDSNINGQVQKTVGLLYIKSLSILYTFDGKGDSSSFVFTGALVLGDLELDLYYQYQSATPSVGAQNASAVLWADGAPDGVSALPAPSSTPTWFFEAFLGAASPSSKLQDVVTSISPSTKLPSFVGNIAINPASGGNSPGKLKLMPIDASGGLILIIQIVLADLDFTFVYLAPATGDSQIIFRISVDKIPVISSIPLIKQLPQPFDSLLYLYLSGDAGLTQGTLDDVINKQLEGLTIPKIPYQVTNTGGSFPVALRAGHHFMVLHNHGEVILDHVFNDDAAGSQDPAQPDATPAAAMSTALVIHPPADAATDNSNDPAPTKGKLDVQLPFLSISGLTFQFKQASLYIDIDASMLLGPINFTVIGFEIVLHLSKVQLNDLSKMLTDGFITFGIHGLSVSIDESPLEIAGVFIHTQGSDPQGHPVEEYMGGVAIGFEAWQFVAVGAYEIVTLPQGNYKSVFIYAKLNGPLFSLGFATISGVRLGFGYNSVVRSPTMAELPQFPFLDGAAEGNAGNDPLKIIRAMTGEGGGKAWVSPQEDAYWGAVGLTLTAFGILSVTAVLMMGFRDGGVDILVLADGVAQMPPDDPDPDATLFYVEIFMLAELNTIEGYFTVQAALAPSSHVLVSSCRLTGGFALFNWFDPNAHSGDFVFSVGGYHPAYTPPSWYPVPARLGISFTLGSMINVTGVVYFAITPKCVMGGGGLSMTLDVGPVSAWLKISLDVFVQFKPFYYTAELKVSVGCAISINVWFVHIRISISIGADLYIRGPHPFGGYADVDFYLFSFTIHFGDEAPGVPALDLFPFYQMVETPGPPPDPNSTATPKDKMMSQLKFVLTAGIYESATAPKADTSAPPSSQFPDSGATKAWNTKAGTWGCTIGCDFALTSATLINDSTATPSTTALLLPDGSNPTPFWAKPMHMASTDSITSTLTITIWMLNPDGSKISVRDGFGGSIVMKQAPVALWDSYDSNNDPTIHAAPGDLTDPNKSTTTLLAKGVALTPPVPILPQVLIQTFDATQAFLWTLESVPLPDMTPKQNTLLARGAGDGGQTGWNKVKSDWTSFGNAGQDILGGKVDAAGEQAPGLLQMAADTLGWDIPSPSSILAALTAAQASTGTAPPTPAWMLNGELPDYLIENLDTQYPVLPRYSASEIAV